MERPTRKYPDLPVKGIKKPKEVKPPVKLPTLESMFGTKKLYLHVLAKFGGNVYIVYSIPDTNTQQIFRKMRKLTGDAQAKYPEAKINTTDVNDRTEISGDLHDFIKAYKANKAAGR